jgi:monoamine oxidase
MMGNCDIIIVGAGAAGLMAAKILSENKITVCILEARTRIGGRVFTINDAGFSKPVEAGAEFIHGNLPLTIALLKKAGIKYHKTAGEIWEHKNGELIKKEYFIEHAYLLEKKLKKADKDMGMYEFLERNFAEDKYGDMKQSICDYVEGYDAANIKETSLLAFKKDWENEEDVQYVIEGGYGALLEHIKDNCSQNGCDIYLSTDVKEIKWTTQQAEIITNGRNFSANKVIIAVPTTLLTQQIQGNISFNPALPGITNAAMQIGHGGVIKVIIEFTHAFWNTQKAKNFFFIFSKETIPTWWSQLPDKTPILTGWLAGPKAEQLSHETDDSFLEHGLLSLSSIFNIEMKILKQFVKASHVHNWIADAFSKEAYSYKSLTTEQGKNILRKPISNTLFFTGEALAKNYYATVEAALQSGKEVAEKILELSN